MCVTKKGLQTFEQNCYEPTSNLTVITHLTSVDVLKVLWMFKISEKCLHSLKIHFPCKCDDCGFKKVQPSKITGKLQTRNSSKWLKKSSVVELSVFICRYWETIIKVVCYIFSCLWTELIKCSMCFFSPIAIRFFFLDSESWINLIAWKLVKPHQRGLPEPGTVFMPVNPGGCTEIHQACLAVIVLNMCHCCQKVSKCIACLGFFPPLH